MKINFPSLFQTPLHNFKFFFIFGNEEIVFERSLSFLQKKLAMPLHLKSEGDVLSQPSFYPSLFEDKSSPSLTLVSPVTDKILPHLDELKTGVFIFMSDKARAQSKLVTHFTQSPTSLAIAAYAAPLSKPEFEFLIGDMSITGTFKELLFKTYQNDYMGLLSTLEKIKLYGDVSETHYETFLNPPSLSDFATLLQEILLKNRIKATELVSSLTPSDLIPFFRSLSRSFQTLLELMPFKKFPKAISWQKLTPPVFFKEQPLYEAALLKWEPKEIQDFLEGLLTLERQVKLTSLPLAQACQHLLLSLK